MTSITINKKSPSQELVGMILNFGRTFGNARAIHDRIMEKGRAETFSDFEITMLAREILKDVWTKDQLSKWFPSKPRLEDSSSKSSSSSKNDENNDTDNSDNGESGEDNDEEPQTPSGQEALAKSNEFYPSDSIDIKNHPVVQRLQHDLEIERQEKTEWKGKFEQLGEVEKKRAFVTATDEMNRFSGESTMSMLLLELRKRQSQGWNKVKFMVEFVK